MKKMTIKNTFLSKLKNIRQLQKIKNLITTHNNGILFQHLKRHSIYLTEILPENEENEILFYQTNNIEWNKKYLIYYINLVSKM